MDPHVRSLFHELSGLTGEERDRIFTERGIDAQLRGEVESLLRYDSTNTGWMQEVLNRELERQPDDTNFCGRYRLTRRLGAGGMGDVYLGERNDGELRQQVAVKLLRPDVDPAVWSAHFLRERQLLADLSHPAIARLLDAGHTEDGRPYLVMEYVDGVTIDEYAEGIDPRQRLRLFTAVCAAVSHAHRRLIIHRDLKPSNILVDPSGQPKLLDFGIARLVAPGENSSQTIDRFMTPEYASPEQLRGGAQTTATDVYSLCAVLCKLLTGRPPRKGFDGASLPDDLRHILKKGLRDEPEERYSSVDALAADVEAFLGNRPVAARAGDAWYRTRKFIRRHSVPVSAAALVLVAFAGSFWMVNRERTIAQRRFEEVRQLSNKLFDIDRQVRQLPGGTKTRQLIVEMSLDYLKRLEKDLKGDPGLTLDVGTAYMRVGRVQGVPISPNLGQAEAAEQNLRTAERLVASVLAGQPGNRLAMIRASQIAHDRMILAQERIPNTEALPLARASQQWLKKYLDSGPVDEAEKESVVIVGMNVANWLANETQREEGLSLLRRTIEVGRATKQPGQVAAAHINLARILRRAGDLDGALAAITEGLGVITPLLGDGLMRSMVYGLALTTKGDILGEQGRISLGRPREAAGFYEQAYKISRELAYKDELDAISRSTAASRGTRLGKVLSLWDPASSLAVLDEVLTFLSQLKNNGKARRDEVRALAASTYPLRALGRHAEARRRLTLAFSKLRDAKVYPAEVVSPGSEAAEALIALAEFDAAGGSAAKGLAVYEEVLSKVFASKPDPASNIEDAYDLCGLYAAMARLHRKAGRPGDAAAWQAKSREVWATWDRKLPNNSFVRAQLDNITPP